MINDDVKKPISKEHISKCNNIPKENKTIFKIDDNIVLKGLNTLKKEESAEVTGTFNQTRTNLNLILPHLFK
jgi:hypothetical protein